MSPFYLSISVAILSSVLYHVFQKATSPAVNPAVALLTTYATAILVTFPLLALFPLESSLRQALARINWASLALGFAIVGLEVGFLLAYRSGWNVSLAGVFSNVSAALLLIPTGLLLFRERPSWVNVLGVLVCVLGLVMVNVKR